MRPDFYSVLLAFGGIIALLACTRQDPVDYAVPAYYHFQFVDSANTNASRELIEKASASFIAHDYIMTEASAEEGWPFYGSIENGTKVRKDELLPPHYTVHIMKPWQDGSEFVDDAEHYKPVFTVLAYDDTVRIRVVNYFLVSGQWTRKAAPPDVRLATGRFTSADALHDRLIKTLMRDTFK